MQYSLTRLYRNHKFISSPVYLVSFFKSPTTLTFAISKSDISSPGYLVVLTSVQALTRYAGRPVIRIYLGPLVYPTKGARLQCIFQSVCRYHQELHHPGHNRVRIPWWLRIREPLFRCSYAGQRRHSANTDLYELRNVNSKRFGIIFLNSIKCWDVTT